MIKLLTPPPTLILQCKDEDEKREQEFEDERILKLEGLLDDEEELEESRPMSGTRKSSDMFLIQF